MGQAPDDRIGTAGAGPERLALALLGFAAALALLLLVPPFFGLETGLAPDFTAQEAVDLFTPIVVLPLAALILELVARPSLRMRLLFIALAAMWVLGQGMHLAANAIDDAARNDAAFSASRPGAIDHWLDEVLSHWVWHVAWFAMLVVTFLAARAAPHDSHPLGRRVSVIGMAAGVIHGFTWFVVTVEGVTAALGIPVAIVLLLLPLNERPPGGTSWVFARFLLGSSAVALVLYALWAALNGWTLPEITPKLGM